jgi:hypothetical protein
MLAFSVVSRGRATNSHAPESRSITRADITKNNEHGITRSETNTCMARKLN